MGMTTSTSEWHMDNIPISCVRYWPSIADESTLVGVISNHRQYPLCRFHFAMGIFE